MSETPAPQYRTIVEAEDVSEEVVQQVLDIVDGWYPGRIDWEDVWDRLERNSDIDMGQDLDSAAIRKIKREVRKARTQG